jgi:hypothetical protein
MAAMRSRACGVCMFLQSTPQVPLVRSDSRRSPRARRSLAWSSLVWSHPFGTGSAGSKAASTHADCRIPFGAIRELPLAQGGDVLFHHIAPELFGGFRETPTRVLLATSAKALFDLSGGRSRRLTCSQVPEPPRNCATQAEPLGTLLLLRYGNR